MEPEAFKDILDWLQQQTVGFVAAVILGGGLWFARKDLEAEREENKELRTELMEQVKSGTKAINDVTSAMAAITLLIQERLK